MPEPLEYLISVQALHDHALTLLDAHKDHDEEDLTVIRNVTQILYSHLQELQEREESHD